MGKDYRTSHLSSDKGVRYHGAFLNNRYRKLVWSLERDILKNIVRKYFQDQDINLFDFACGTGRILSFMEGYSVTALGVDVSRSMLDEARKNCVKATLLEVDLTRTDVLNDQLFNCVTAFRFFPNAQASLRSEAMRVIKKHLSSDGYFIFNNHKNSASLRYKLARMRGRGGELGMSKSEISELLEKHKMEIIDQFHLCIIPSGEERILLPIFLLTRIENILRKIPWLFNYGENQIFICRHQVS